MNSVSYSWKDLGEKEKSLAAKVMGDEMVKLAPIPTTLEPKLRKDLNIKAVLFDIYGTILISGTGDISLAREKENLFSLKAALKRAELSLCLVDVDKELIKKQIDEIGLFHKEQRALGADFPEVDIISIWDRVLKSFQLEELLEDEFSLESLVHLSAYHEIVSNPIWEMPGAFSTLTDLKEKYPLGIISNAQYYTPLAIELLAESSLSDLGFKKELCSWSYQLLRGKPSKVLFEAPLKEFEKQGIRADEILYVGNDMLNDIYTASLWGCRTALFAGDKRSLRLREEDHRCSDLTPDLILTELSQLKEIL